jgi:hypothetical protein
MEIVVTLLPRVHLYDDELTDTLCCLQLGGLMHFITTSPNVCFEDSLGH